MSKKKKYLYKKKVNIPIYDFDLMIVLSNSVKKVNDLTGIDRNGLFAEAVQNTYKGRLTYFIVLNLDSKWKKVTNGTIAHEALHVSDYLFSTIGMNSDVDNDETQAYLVGWLHDQVTSFIKEKKMINKIKI